jgi:hypothetical protein
MEWNKRYLVREYISSFWEQTQKNAYIFKWDLAAELNLKSRALSGPTIGLLAYVHENMGERVQVCRTACLLGYYHYATFSLSHMAEASARVTIVAYL